MKIRRLFAAAMAAMMLSAMTVTSFAADTASIAANSSTKTSIAPTKYIDGIKTSLLVGVDAVAELPEITFNKVYTAENSDTVRYKFSILANTAITFNLELPYVEDYIDKYAYYENTDIYWGITNNSDFIHKRTINRIDVFKEWTTSDGKVSSQPVTDSFSMTLKPGTYYFSVRNAIKPTFKLTASTKYILNSAMTNPVPAISLQKGKTISLSAVTSAANTKYTSSDTKIAKVSSKGIITPVGNGSCYITAECNNTFYKFRVIVSGFAEDPIERDPIFIEATAKNVLLDTNLLGFQMGDDMATVKKGIGDPDIQGKSYMTYNSPNFTAFGRFLESASYCFDEEGSLVMIDYVWSSAATTSNAKKDLSAMYDMIKKSIISEYGNPEGVSAADGSKFALWTFDKPISGNISGCILDYLTDNKGRTSLTLTLDGAVAGVGMDMPEPSLY